MASIEEPEQKTWCGEFNWYGEIHKLYCTSPSFDQAFRFLCLQLSKKVGHRTSNDVRHYFYATDRYMIKEVKKLEQKKDESSIPNSC
jgi:hypothetical protein